MNAETIARFLTDMSNPLTFAEISSINAALRRRHTMQCTAAANVFNIGNTVSFTHNGEVKTGIVRRVNRKTVGVAVKDKLTGRELNWKVPPSMLTRPPTLSMPAGAGSF